MIDQFAAVALAFIRAHEAWAPPVVFALAFGESLALVSLVLPATAILLGLGGALGAAGLAFWPVWAAAVAGAAAGDWASFWIGRRYRDDIGAVWPLSRRPDLLRRGHVFFARWGLLGVFLGRFFGPLRSIMPLVAGMCGMPALPFQLANIVSALLWATGVLAPGTLALRWLL